MTTVVRTSDWREFLALRRPWEELASRNPDGVLLGHDWAAQCWKCAGSAEVIGARNEAGDWLGLAAWRRFPGWLRRLAFLDDQRSQRLGFLIAQGREAEVRAAIATDLGRRRDWDVLDLHHLRASTASAILSEWPRHGLRVRNRGGVQQRTLRLMRPWQEIEAGFRPELRSNFRRREKRLQRLGNLRLDMIVDRKEIGRALADCFQLEALGWKGAHGTAILAQPLLHRFYRQLAYRLAVRHRLLLFCLLLDGRVIAFEYCVAAAGGAVASLKIGYDPAYGACSPGTVLRWRLLERIHVDYGAYEFLGEDEPWKRDWTDELVQLRNLRVYNNTWRGRALLFRARAYQAWSRKNKVADMA